MGAALSGQAQVRRRGSAAAALSLVRQPGEGLLAQEAAASVLRVPLRGGELTAHVQGTLSHCFCSECFLFVC